MHRANPEDYDERETYRRIDSQCLHGVHGFVIDFVVGAIRRSNMLISVTMEITRRGLGHYNGPRGSETITKSRKVPPRRL